MRPPTSLARSALVGLAVLAVLGGAAACSDSTGSFGVEDSTETAIATYDYTIPLGAAEALDAGEPLEILPARLDGRVGETIRIVNDDIRGHSVGPWFVGRGETLTQTFTSPGEFIGQCTVHPSGEFRVVIT